MTYMLVIVEAPGDRQKAGRAEGEKRYARMLDFAAGLKERGLLIRTELLTPQTDAVRVRRHNGKVMTVDGPFAEAKEMIGGFFLLDCDTRDEAIDIANDCPAADWATVEVRALGPCFIGSD